MEHLENIYASLRAAVEKAIGRKLQTPRDFDYLAYHSLETTKQYVSAMTLKRFWGYVEVPSKNKYQPRLSTLNILAQVVGYVDWETYYAELSGTGHSQSAFLHTHTLFSSSLEKGALIQLQWHPNRKLLIRYEGNEAFTVITSEHCKLSVGDTFRCAQFIEGQALTIGGLIHEGKKYPGYVCGLEKGIHHEITNANAQQPPL